MPNSHMVIQHVVTTTQTAAGECITATLNAYSNHDGTATLMLGYYLNDDKGNEIHGNTKTLAVTLNGDQMLALADQLTRLAGR